MILRGVYIGMIEHGTIEQKRVVKGIWIPIEIWENETLSIQEKVILAEIDSFCNHYESCYASNEHFANFIGVGTRRIQKILKSLEDKNLVERDVIYKKGTKEIEKRFLRVRYPSCPKVHGGGVQKFVGGGVQKFADNNTSMNETLNNNNIYGQNAKNEQSKKRKVFIPPSLEEVEAYITEKQLNINPKTFWDYYESADWHDSKGKAIRSWKQKCLMWQNYNKDKQVEKPTPSKSKVDWSVFDG